jgi:hypothetical protein
MSDMRKFMDEKMVNLLDLQFNNKDQEAQAEFLAEIKMMVEKAQEWVASKEQK